MKTRRSRKKKTIITRTGREFGDLLAKYNRRNGPLLAKGLGFSFLIGLIPLLFLTVSITGYLYEVIPNLRKFVEEDFLSFVPLAPREILLSHIDAASGSWEAIGILGLFILLTISMSLFDSIERSMATMLSAPRRKFHFGRLISLALMVGTVLFFFIAAGLSTAVTYFRSGIGISSPTLVYWGGKAISWFLFAGILIGLYYLFARRRLRFLPTLGIALLASLVWHILGIVGSTVIRYAGRRVIIYGALAWVTIFLIYMRILAELILISSLVVSQASPPREN